MKIALLERGYNEQIINAAIEKAKLIPRERALKRSKKKSNASKKPILATKYDPRLPALPKTIAKHWRSMKSQDEYLAQVFKEPPLTAFKKQKNLRDLLIRAKVPGPIKSKPERKLKGMFRCNTDKCTACPFPLQQNWT